MKCNKCGSENVNIQMVTEVKKKKKGLAYWLLFGWALDLLAWFIWTVPRIIIKIFKPSRYKTTKQAICQSCGHSWQI